MPNTPEVTDADRAAAESITPLICDDCPCDHAENVYKIANAMTPERERAARVEKALREIIHDLSGVRNWFLAEQSTDANEMAEIVKSSMGSARAALGEE